MLSEWRRHRHGILGLGIGHQLTAVTWTTPDCEHCEAGRPNGGREVGLGYAWYPFVSATEVKSEPCQQLSFMFRSRDNVLVRDWLETAQGRYIPWDTFGELSIDRLLLWARVYTSSRK